jgi:hypothetical protein
VCDSVHRSRVSIIRSIPADGVVISPLIIIKRVVIQYRWFVDIRDSDIATGSLNQATRMIFSPSPPLGGVGFAIFQTP